jgi:tetratricopeptide (TPR) repeat protein
VFSAAILIQKPEMGFVGDFWPSATLDLFESYRNWMQVASFLSLGKQRSGLSGHLKAARRLHHRKVRGGRVVDEGYVRIRSLLVGVCLNILLGAASAQTFDLSKPGHDTTPGNKKNASPQAENSVSGQQQGLGWGSSIEVARQARAAQDALKRGDYAAATTFAAQAAKSAPQNPDFWFLYGYAARLDGHYGTSIDAFNRGLKLAPNSLQGLSGLAQTYAKMGRDEDARQLLLKVVAANPKDVNALSLAGELLLDSDPNKALELLRQADTLQASARTELLIARAYQRLNQPDQANQFLARAKRHAPHDPEILRAMAGEYRDAGQYDLAISTLQALPQKDADVLAELAYTYQLAGKPQEAANLYTRAAESAHGNVGLELNAAQALVNLGQFDAARQFLEKVQELNGNNYRLHAILAQIAESENQVPQAIQEYQLALKTLPNSVPEGPLYPVQLRLNLYQLYEQNGDQANAKQELETAATELQQAQVEDSSRPELLRLRAAIESASGDDAAADKDLKDALQLAPKDVNSILSYGNLVWKLGQKDTSRAMFLKALEIDPRNRQALISLGYLSRDMGDRKGAEDYFSQAAKLSAKDYVPYVALGDLYASERKFDLAEKNYEAAYQRAPGQALIVAGGTNAALESHQLDLAKVWLSRAKGAMNENPQVMREHQRYLTWTGHYKEAADLGFKVIEKLPRDPQAPVYLAYDLYYLGRYQEALDLAIKYDSILPNNRDLALIEGYVHVRSGKLHEALADFTHAVERDPQMATGFANRGFVLNDLKQAGRAARDFETAIKLEPNYGEAHLGLAYADLQLHRPMPALDELDTAKKLLGESHSWHLARAEAFRQEQNFPSAEEEYRAALQEIPDDATTQLALANVLYRMHRYDESIKALQAALKLSPGDAGVYAQMAQVYAKLGQREEAFRYVQAAEQYGKDRADVLMATGVALLTLGERDAAMQRFSAALDAPEGDRIDTRLAIAEIFMKEGQWDDARRQIGLALAEARVGDAPPPTPDNFIEVANLLAGLHDFGPAQNYFIKAKLAGADDRAVAIGLTNTYLAEGDTHKAQLELASLGDPSQYRNDFDYMMASANLYREDQNTVHALSAFAQASALSSQDSQNDAQKAQYELAGEEGRQLTQNVSLFSEASFAPTLEDINVYTLDAHILGVTNPALLPTPRHSFQSFGAAHYRLHFNNIPTISGFVGESMTSGRLLFPSTSVVEDRHTFDTILNGGVSPVLRLGSNTFAFNTGLQFTVRRDTLSPFDMNQNLFRQYLYLSTSPFFNWITVQGSAIREAGPFTEQNLHSRDAAATLEFTVGRPWGHTSLITGYSVRDLLFRPEIREYFTTSTYAGVQHKFGNRLTVGVLGEYLRSWQVLDTKYVLAQAMHPAARFDYRPSSRWAVHGSFALSRGEGFHAYDNAESEFTISYLRPVERRLEDGKIDVPVDYPSRFSFGLVQQTFYDFTDHSRTTLLPVVRFTLF